MIRSILGPNAFLAKQRLAELLAGVEVNSIERFEGSDLDLRTLDEALHAQSLFFSPTIVLSNVSEQKTLHEDVIILIEKLSDEVELIIYEPNIDKRSKYYKFLIKNTDCSEYKKLDESELHSWIVKQATERGGKIDHISARHLVDRVGEDQWQLSNELDKLLLSTDEISVEQIDLMVEPTPKESIFKLLDAVVAGNQAQALDTYENLRQQKLDANYVISMLAWQMNIVAMTVHAGSRTSNQIASEAKISPYTAQKTMSLTKNISKSKLKTMLEAIAKLDADLKSKPIDGDEAMKQLLIKLSN